MGITRVLVANRGEIARRVFATCRRLGLGTVAVYTDPDAAAPHVAEADARVRLPKTNDYLNAEAIIAAARAAGADAVHPGYGFLSENAEFAAAVQEAGLTWVGPPVDAVRAMGSKIESKKLMAAAGVPVLDELDPDTVTEAQLPVLVKASAGGGGRGMRVVRELSALSGEVAAAQREAQSAFGDPTVFCERYLPTGHHVEVQVMADTHGTVWAVGERECSIQRRHQKIIEEAPSPLVERMPGMRAKLFDAARLAAGAIGYTGAGTVEFLADDDGEFYFLEMNTRLQVEHPVTEETTGLDLVELQLDVADGGRLDAEPPAAQRAFDRGPALRRGSRARLAAPGRRGAHDRRAVGCAPSSPRWDSEPGSGWTPASSTARRCRSTTTRCWPRSSPMRPTRRQSALVLADALARTRLHGLRTNRELLVNVLRHPAFLDGATDTAFFDTHGLAELSAPLADTRRSGCRRSPPRLPTPRTIARPQQCSARFPAAGATWRRAIRSRPTATTPTPSIRSNTVSPEPDWCLPDDRRCNWSRRRRTRWCWPTDGVACQFRGRALRPRHLRRFGTRPRPPGRAAALPRAGFGRRAGIVGGAHARQRHPARRRGRRRRHRRSAADLAGGNEDGAHHHRADRRRAHRAQRHHRPASRSRRRPSTSGSA